MTDVVRRAGVALAVALACAATLPACTGDDVVVAEVHPATTPGGPGGVGATCTDDAGCTPGLFCARAACTAATGLCEARPTACGGEGQLVCGCDGVTYWNDCLRKQRGVTAATAGDCVGGAAPCTGPADCPVPGASCARIAPPGMPCSPDLGGRCWVLAQACPLLQDDAHFEACGKGPGPGPGMESCVDLCNAVRTSVAHRPVQSCPP